MARSPIEIALASETKAFKQGIETGVIKPLEDAIKKLRDLGDTDGADELEKQLRDAQRATERLGDETKVTAARIEREYRDAYRQMKRSAEDASDESRRSMGKVGERSAEVGQEVRQNLGEGIANAARGDFEALSDTIGDTFGGAVAGIGGLGTAALGVAGALGLGAVTAAFQAIQQEQDRAAEAAARWAEAFITAGGDVIGAAHTVAEVTSIATDPERYKQAQDNARNWGIDVSTAMRAMAGDATALTIAQDGVNQKMVDYEAQGSKTSETALNLRNQWEAGKNSLQQLNGDMEAGRTAARNVSDALLAVVAASSDAAVEVDELGNKVVTLPDGAEIMINAKTGQASQDVSRFKGDVDGVVDHLNGREVVVKVRRDSSDWDNWYPGVKVGKVRVAVGQGGGGGITWEG